MGLIFFSSFFWRERGGGDLSSISRSSQCSITGVTKDWSYFSFLLNGAYKRSLAPNQKTGPNGAVAMSSVNGMVGTGFASRYRLQPRAGF